jgi:hypothetical protein
VGSILDSPEPAARKEGSPVVAAGVKEGVAGAVVAIGINVPPVAMPVKNGFVAMFLFPVERPVVYGSINLPSGSLIFIVPSAAISEFSGSVPTLVPP